MLQWLLLTAHMFYQNWNLKELSQSTFQMLVAAEHSPQQYVSNLLPAKIQNFNFNYRINIIYNWIANKYNKA